MSAKMCCSTCIWWLRNPYVEGSVPTCLCNRSPHYRIQTVDKFKCGYHDRKPSDDRRRTQQEEQGQNNG